ncbi:hypothetical protein H1220_04495 [Carnobacteriaceae bacterium zg-84]|uniref:hypothetical protein n=1 Tax=Granulicatella sp. zg-84 TaxID=2678503 RepID=UPI0013C20DC4|nr:hypothetical protein [Granulicatella sp. zg-84]NEW66080.1 hypothetical protein [Granulicatella sp. zg-84]QMI85010.1 hypothetical protein H1220_04495 [Carnobacteriaceae bacterium zg-84]
MLKNPWKDIVEEINDSGNKQIFAADDKTFLDNLRSREEYEKLNDKYKLNLNVYPLHYIGDIKKAKILVLGLNPGVNDEYIEFYNTFDESYQKKIKRNLDFSEPRFFEFDSYKDKQGYWKKLRTLFPEEYAQKIEFMKNSLDTSKIDGFFNKNIAVVEFFPYHSEAYNNKEGLEPLVNKVIKEKGYLPTQKFVFEIISERLKKKDVVIIIYRAVSKWMDAVEGLSDYDKVFVTTNPQKPSLKIEKLVKANYGKEILEVIER